MHVVDTICNASVAHAVHAPSFQIDAVSICKVSVGRSVLASTSEDGREFR